jgi:hypothetical protein
VLRGTVVAEQEPFLIFLGGLAGPSGEKCGLAGCGPLEKQPPELKSLRENSKNRYQGGEIRERAREAGAKARHILNRLRPD